MGSSSIAGRPMVTGTLGGSGNGEPPDGRVFPLCAIGCATAIGIGKRSLGLSADWKDGIGSVVSNGEFPDTTDTLGTKARDDPNSGRVKGVWISRLLIRAEVRALPDCACGTDLRWLVCLLHSNQNKAPLRSKKGAPTTRGGRRRFIP